MKGPCYCREGQYSFSSDRTVRDLRSSATFTESNGVCFARTRRKQIDLGTSPRGLIPGRAGAAPTGTGLWFELEQLLGSRRVNLECRDPGYLLCGGTARADPAGGEPQRTSYWPVWPKTAALVISRQLSDRSQGNDVTFPDRCLSKANCGLATWRIAFHTFVSNYASVP